LALFSTKRDFGGKPFKLVLDKPIPKKFLSEDSGNPAWKSDESDDDNLSTRS
jgi:hypothetical protein